ncbi:MAG: hypothetical protein IJ229_04860 [Clostridia bacterium]|nr:hypothetical protein [Clostridia bacterium]MBR1683529.1 hypothetical protein [Clostridia bacterium]
MSIVLQHDNRVGITYAYHNKAVWDKDLKKASTSRILIGKLDPVTGEIVKSSGKRRKTQIEDTVVDAEINEFNQKVRDKKKAEEGLVAEDSLELQELKMQYDQLLTKFHQLETILTTFADSINECFGEKTTPSCRKSPPRS